MCAGFDKTVMNKGDQNELYSANNFNGNVNRENCRDWSDKTRIFFEGVFHSLLFRINDLARGGQLHGLQDPPI